MTISADLYIQNITDSAGTETNPEFAITFPVYSEEDIWVWTKAVATGVLTKQERGTDYIVKIDAGTGSATGTTATLVWIGTTPAYGTATIRIQRHMERVQQDEYKDHRLGTTNSSIEASLDKLSMMGQQSLEVDSEQRHWTAGGDRVINLKDGTTTDDATSKSQVDDLVGGGTNPFTVSSGDVGKYRKYSTAVTPTGSWATFNGLADPKGYEFMYYTVEGWVDISGNLPPIAGSADNDKVLMDIKGTPAWVLPSEVPVTFADSPSVTVGRPYSIVTHSSARVSTVRDFSALPDLLPNVQSQRLVGKETGYSTANNKVEMGRFFKVTTHTVTCTKRTGSQDHSGISGVSSSNDTVDHPVYIGSISNITADANVTVFLCPHKHNIPDDESINGHTATRWWTGPHWIQGNDPNDAILNLSSAQEPKDFSFIMNVYEQDGSNIKFSAASLLHESMFIWGNMSNWGGHPQPDDDYRIRRFMKHPASMDITFNVLWYLQKS